MREIGTLICWATFKDECYEQRIWGMLVLLIERNVWCIPYEVLRYLFLSVLLIPIINFSVFIKREKGTFLMCVVFLCITVTHGNDESPLSFGVARILDTTIGRCWGQKSF